MGDFGPEFVRATPVDDPLVERVPFDRELWSRLQDTTRGFYFPPYDFILNESTGFLPLLPLQRFPDGVERRVLLIEQRHTLWFARGARIVLDGPIALIIRGDIRADPTTIFSLPDVRVLSPTPTVPVPDASSVPLGPSLVRIESTRVRAIHPEWFGVVASPGKGYLNEPTAAMNTRAFQACLHAACRDRTRDGVSLPPVPVIATGIYCIQDTLDVLPDENGRGALWMVGDGDASSRNAGIPSLTRFQRSIASSISASARDRSEPDDSALLRVDPRVSLEVAGVGFRCIHDAPHSTPAGREVRRTILVNHREGVGAQDSPPERHAFFDRCSFTGGRDATVGLHELGGGGKVPDPTSARGALRSSTRFAFRDCSFDAGLGGDRSSHRIIDATVGMGVMMTVSGGVVYQVRSGFAPPGTISLESGLHLRGTSTLVRSVSFHLGEGPRPSRPAPEGGQPAQADGQDIWLDSADGALAPHLTVLHADSQSWWFLGGTPTRSDAAGVVSLLNVGAGDVNLLDALAATPVESGLRADPLQTRTLFMPPSIEWPGGNVPLLLEGCLFRRYATIEGDRTKVVNVGTSFFVPIDEADAMGNAVFSANWFPPRVIPRPPFGHTLGQRIPSEILLRRDALSYYPLELPQLRAVP